MVIDIRQIACASVQGVSSRPIAFVGRYQPTRRRHVTNTPPQVQALAAGAPVIGEGVRFREFRSGPPGEVVPRIRIPLAPAYHFGNGRRVGFLDQCQPCPDRRFLVGGHGCRRLPDGRGKGFRRYRVRVAFQNIGMGRLGTAGHFQRIAVKEVNQPPAGSGALCRQCTGIPFGRADFVLDLSRGYRGFTGASLYWRGFAVTSDLKPGFQGLRPMDFSDDA